MASEITLLDEMFKVDEVDDKRYDRGALPELPTPKKLPMPKLILPQLPE